MCVDWSAANCGMFACRAATMVASRLREPFFLVWSLLVVASIAVGIVMESRSNTPMLGAFILPLIFAAISYPVVADRDRGLATLVFAAALGALIGQSARTDVPADDARVRRGDGRLAGLRRERRAAQLSTGAPPARSSTSTSPGR